MVLSPRIAAYLDPDDACVFEKGPMERLVRDGQLKAFRHEGFWQCMDTYREQQMLDRMWMSGSAPWKVW
jgi:glucose-1-phosphate cytidylyltransferase